MTAEWRHAAARFQAFVAHLEPTAVERASAMAVASDVGLWLKRRFVRPRLDRAPEDGAFRIIGGCGKDTAMRSAATVDVLFVLPERLRANADGVARRRSAGLSPVLRQTIAAMTGRFGSIERLQEGWLAVRPTAASGEPRPGVRVRVLPGFACADGGYWIASPNGKVESGPWWRLHPQAELAHLDRADAMSGGQARHLIRMLKAWRRTSGAALGSLALELLACEFLSVWLYRRRSALFYDWMVRDCFFWLAAEAGRTLSIPGTHEILAIDDAWRLQAEAAHAAAAAASDLEHDNRSDAALARWRAIFGPAFPDVPKPSAPTQTSSKRTGPTLLAVE